MASFYMCMTTKPGLAAYVGLDKREEWLRLDVAMWGLFHGIYFPPLYREYSYCTRALHVQGLHFVHLHPMHMRCFLRLLLFLSRSLLLFKAQASYSIPQEWE